VLVLEPSTCMGIDDMRRSLNSLVRIPAITVPLMASHVRNGFAGAQS
jgi:hypothetical protein